MSKDSSFFFPRTIGYKPLIFDPVESQSYGYFTRMKVEGKSIRGLYAPFSVGFNKPIYRWKNTSQLNMDISVFTQFDMFGENGKFHRFMKNADYKIGLSYVWHKKNWDFRLRGFHISSHLGDDYLLNNGLEVYKNNPVNYEQLDFISIYKVKNIKLYGSVGYGIRPHFRHGNERKRLSFQTGFMYEKVLRNNNHTFIIGLDNRILEQNNFYPGTMAGMGLGFRIPDNDRTFYLMIDVYNGHIPYGKFEAQKCRWIGLGFTFQP